MLLPGLPRPLSQRIKRIPLQSTRRRHLPLPAPQHLRPVLNHVLHPQRVEGHMLPLQDHHRLVGERIHPQPQHGDILGEIVGDATGLVAGLPGEGGEVVWVADDGGAGGGDGDFGGGRVGRGGGVVGDVGEVEGGAGGGEGGGDVPGDFAGGLGWVVVSGGEVVRGWW